MFYLIEFFKTIKDSSLRGIVFIILSCCLAFALTHRPWVAEVVNKVSPEKVSKPFLIAVADQNVSSEKFSQFLKQLPGVIEFDEKTSAQNQSKLQELIKDLGTDYELSSDLMNFKSFRVLLNPALSQESLEFIREQLIKFGGKEHLSTSEITYPELTQVMKNHPFYYFLSHFGDWSVILVLAAFWIISYWMVFEQFRSRAYIIEKFQRKRLVSAKVMALGLAMVAMIFLGLGFYHNTLKFFDFILMMMVFSIFWTFNLKPWNWKSNL